MKCPYCGWESENQHCDHCKAWIPTENPKEKPEEPVKVRKRNKESD